MARTVLVIDDSSAFRASARMLLQARGYEVVGVAGDIASGVAAVHELRPDCVVMDVNLPDGNGLDAARTLALDGHAPAIVLVSTLDESAIGDVQASGARGFVLSQHAEERYAVDLIGDSAEGVGYLLKDRVTDFALFADAVRRVAARGSVLDPTVVSHMLGRKR